VIGFTDPGIVASGARFSRRVIEVSRMSRALKTKLHGQPDGRKQSKKQSPPILISNLRLHQSTPTQH
jgi:hypothetical protein